MITLAQLEIQHNFSFPKLYKRLFESDMTNWMRGFEEPLGKNLTWAENIYPTLKEHPPLLLHSGGSDFELLTPHAILHFEFPKSWDTKTHHFIPFATTSEGNTYAFYNHSQNQNINIEDSPIVLIWEDDEAEYIAKNFEDFIFCKMLQASDDIDKDDLYADYGKDHPMEAYRTDLLSDLKSIRPYLSEAYISILENAYQGEVLETLISYGFTTTTPIKSILKETIYFAQMGEVFEHEI